MNKKDDPFLKELLAVFKVEADEHLREISTGLLELEKLPDGQVSQPLLETIYRGAHSLKGAARAVDLTSIEQVCQSLENVLSKWKKGEIKLLPDQFDVIYRSLDAITELLSPQTESGVDITATSKSLEELVAGSRETGPAAVGKDPSPSEKPEESGVKSVRKADAAAPTELNAGTPEAAVGTPVQPVPAVKTPVKTAAKPAAPEAVPEAPLPPVAEAGDQWRVDRDDTKKVSAPETVRISTTKLDTLFVQAEEMLSIKHVSAQRIADHHELVVGFDAFLKNFEKAKGEFVKLAQQIKPGDRRSAGRELEKVQDFFEIGQDRLKALESRLSTLERLSEDDHRVFGGRVDNLLEDMKKVLLLPFNPLLNSFLRMIRDISRQQGKDVDLQISGGEVEIDKRILEEIKDPLVHLLRNCVDHGIEAPAEREKKGKARRGSIKIGVSYLEGGTVEILVSDDGCGIDAAKVKEAAVRHGVITAEEAARVDPKEALLLIFQSAVSTSPIITELSGRGLGLAIVREKTEKLGGRVSVTTAVGTGTTFRIVLPLNLATYRGIMVKVSGHSFIVPIANVERTLRIKPEEIKTVENKECISIGGEVMSLARMENILGLSGTEEKHVGDAPEPLLILGSANTRIAFTVDEVSSEQEIIVKSLGKQLARVRNITGATVTGSGEVVPILNVSDLIRSAVRSGTLGSTASANEESSRRNLSVLIAEDSITSRMLIKNILESNGYIVTTAVDGMDAWTKLRTMNVDLVVSDIDMPRMTGFELASKIRADAKLSELPLVLLTARESREDRERGVEVGANAYIVKSSFDQSVLLNVLKRIA